MAWLKHVQLLAFFVCVSSGSGLVLKESDDYIEQLTKRAEELDYGSLIDDLESYVDVDDLVLSHDEYSDVYKVDTLGSDHVPEQFPEEIEAVVENDEELAEETWKNIEGMFDSVEEKFEIAENDIEVPLEAVRSDDAKFKMAVKTDDANFKMVENIQKEITLLEIIFFVGIFVAVALLTSGLFICFFRLLCVPSTPTAAAAACNEEHNKKIVKLPGVIKSYARLPVEIRNMKPSNVAYKELYEA